MASYTIGLDYGSNSVRAIIVDTTDGRVCGSNVYAYSHGDMGVIGDVKDPNVARQHPADYLEGLELTVLGAMLEAGVEPAKVVGIGVDATASTPLPVDAQGQALALTDAFKEDPDAMAWLWKDHSSLVEANEITAKAAALRPEYLAKCGGTYSSEWYWSKILHCARVAPRVYAAAHDWIELPDWIPFVLTGQLSRCLCAASFSRM